jgi:hypothetical protein
MLESVITTRLTAQICFISDDRRGSHGVHRLHVQPRHPFRTSTQCRDGSLKGVCALKSFLNGWEKIKGKHINVNQVKADDELDLFKRPALLGAIEALLHDKPTFLTTAFGKVFTPAVENCFREVAMKLAWKLPDLVLSRCLIESV